MEIVTQAERSSRVQGREREIMDLRDNERLTWIEIGKRMGVSGSRASDIYNRGYRRKSIQQAREGQGRITADGYVDEKGREWKIVARAAASSTTEATFLGTWVNRKGYKNVALFVRLPTGRVWGTSIDGPFSTKAMRDAYAKETARQ